MSKKIMVVVAIYMLAILPILTPVTATDIKSTDCGCEETLHPASFMQTQAIVNLAMIVHSDELNIHNGDSMPTFWWWWSVISSDMLSCYLGCLFDLGITIFLILEFVALILGGVTAPLALAQLGLTTIQVMITAACFTTCAIKFG